MSELVYLASPYTPLGNHTSEERARLCEERFEQVCRAAAKLMEAGYVVFCPIAHSHPIDKLFGKPGSGAFWQRQDAPYLDFCGSMVVLTLPGWRESKGVAHEIMIAQTRGLPVLYMEPA